MGRRCRRHESGRTTDVDDSAGPRIRQPRRRRRHPAERHADLRRRAAGRTLATTHAEIVATEITKKATKTTKTTDDLVVEIDAIGTSGEGLARVGHRRVSVPLTIPGERVRVRLERAHEGH